MVTYYSLNGRGIGVRVPVGSRIFSSPRRLDRHWNPQPPIQWLLGALSSEVEWQEREADHSPHLQLVPRSRKTFVYTPTPPYPFMT
jgi:hypothetical protein